MSRFASRKFILAVLSLFVSTWLVFEKVIDAGDYKTILIGTVGAYIVGNVAQKVTGKDAAAS